MWRFLNVSDPFQYTPKNEISILIMGVARGQWIRQETLHLL